ncbi:PAS domain-containing sensor histidine kinase [Pedobacter ureilyticus]|uniref:histidine kinase n=1 Tax=Pedobacter ureilyticus TaxID=1393051 RepID=A0ABW9JC33_9SPHI|nr:ATP-binding protein [Pedobacter helvus]
MKNQEKSILVEMAESADEIFFVFDPKSQRFTYVNDAFEHFSRSNASELYTNPRLFLNLIHPDDRKLVISYFEQLLIEKVNTLFDFRILREDGVERWVRLKVYPILKDGKVNFLSGILEDDSTRKMGIFNMQSINAWKNSTLEILAHELTGPIGIVQELSKAVARKLPQDTAGEAHEWLAMISEICRRNLELVQTIIKKESLQTVDVKVNLERFELVSEVGQVIDIYLNSQLNAQRKFIFTHSDEELYASVDGMKYLQIVNNLLSNAVKFTKQGGTIKVHLESLEHTFLLTVADDGIGIPQHLQPLLFHKYTPAGRQGNDGQPSVGLGMWIIKNYVDMHHGKVWFESEENVGTKFLLNFRYR